MTLDAAIIKEQGILFAVVIVKPHVTASQDSADQMRRSLATVSDFANLPIILASQDSKGRFEYQGRRDIVDFLASIDSARIPWNRYTIS